MTTKPRRHKTVRVNCGNCGIEFDSLVSRIKEGRGKFCTLKCYNEFYKSDKNTNYSKKYVGKENGKTAFDKVKNSYYVYWFEPETLKRKTTSYARWYWEVNVGLIPEGYRASYKDGNTLNISPENIVLISPDEFGDAISKRLTGKPFSEEHKKHLSESFAGKKLSEEHKLHIGNASRKMWANGDFDEVHKGENNYWWRGGVQKPYDKEFFGVRALVVQRDRYKCQICGVSVSDKSEAHVHHIDGNKGNNEMENLILFCPSCHSLVHHWTPEAGDVYSAFHSKLYK